MKKKQTTWVWKDENDIVPDKLLAAIERIRTAHDAETAALKEHYAATEAFSNGHASLKVIKASLDKTSAAKHEYLNAVWAHNRMIKSSHDKQFDIVIQYAKKAKKR